MTDAWLKPGVFWRITDNRLEMSLRFVAPDRGVRQVKDRISRDILAALYVHDVSIASATYDILEHPIEIGTPRRERKPPMAVTAFQDFPLADRDRDWDGSEAESRVRDWAGAADAPNEKYRDAFVWYDADNKDNFTAYKLLIADVIDDKLHAVPHAVMSAGGVMQGARGGVDLPDKDRDRVKSHLAKYYAKMDDQAPWDSD